MPDFQTFMWNAFASVSLAQEKLASLLENTDLDIKTRRSLARVMIYSMNGTVESQLKTLEWKRDQDGAILYRVVKGKRLIDIV